MVSLDRSFNGIIVEPVKGAKWYDFSYKVILHKALIRLRYWKWKRDTLLLRYLEKLRPKLKGLRSLTKDSFLDIN